MTLMGRSVFLGGLASQLMGRIGIGTSIGGSVGAGVVCIGEEA